jgi:RHS repeat-associated protein
VEKNIDASDANPFRFNSGNGYFDNETGLGYNAHRYYDPSIGRWTQEDTHWNTSNMIYGDNNSSVPDIKSIMQSANLYLYCINNPLMEEWYLTFKEPTVKSRTSEKLRGYMKNHIKLEFGKLDVEQIDTFRVQRFANGMLKRGTCMTTVQQIKNLMNQFYKEYIMKMKLVHENPLDDVKIKSVGNNDQDRDSLALAPELRAVDFEKL